MPLTKIISGGQSGIDTIALRCAKKSGLTTGGYAPKNYMTENGPNYDLGSVYHLKEHDSTDYRTRTIANIKEADATIIFGDLSSPGSKCTISSVKNLKKPFITNPSKEQLIHFLTENNVSILNIAGNRQSKLSMKDALNCESVLSHVFTIVQK